MAKVEAMGELKRITAEVDPDLEASPSPIWSAARKVRRSCSRTSRVIPVIAPLYNMVGCNLSRFCLMIGEELVDHPFKAVQALQRKMGRTMKPKEVPPETAICNQNVVPAIRSNPAIPAQRMWPLDGGLISALAMRW